MMSDWRWVNIPVHTAIEVLGGVIALLVCFLLVNLEQSNRGTSYNIIIAAAIGVMGILDIAHALLSPGNTFVWLHSAATFFGGMIFALILLPSQYAPVLNARFVWLMLIFALLLSTFAVVQPHFMPNMVTNNEFTSLAVFLNISGGVALLLCAGKLFFQYRQFRKIDDLLFILHCSMFGFAAIMFHQSFLWDISWWGWHILRLLAYGVALWFALLNERFLFAQLQSSNQSLVEKERQTKASLDIAHKRIAMSEKQQAAVLAGLSDAIIVINNKGIIKLFSKSAQAMFGWHKSDVLGKNITLLMNEKFAAQHDDYVANYQMKSTPSMIGKNRDLIAKRKGGKEFPIELTISHVLLDDEHHYVGVIRDITDRKAQEALTKQAKDAAESANNAKSAFLANTSHEIRTPMNGVYGNLQLLSELSLNKTAKNYVNNALDSTKTLMTVVNDILDFSKIEAGKLTIEKTEFLLTDILNNIHANLSPTAHEKHISFNILNQVEHDNWIGDPIRIKQVLLNITANAIKFTEQGSVTLSVLYDGKKQIMSFIINDTGIGMTQSSIEKLFKRFEQADDSITRQYGGTGLGMSITHSLVELMDGHIEVKSELKQGSCFIVKLPMSSGSKKQTTTKQQTTTLDLENKHILLVEDNPINQLLVKAMLAPSNAKITLAENGELALSYFNNSIDLILMDIQMPIMDGITATKKIREKNKTVPIIALTANIIESDLREYNSAGCNDWVGKPIEKNLLLEKLKTYLIN